MKILTWNLVGLLILTLVICGYNFYQSITHPLKFEQDIIIYAKEYNLSPEIVASLINVESSFNDKAKSTKNAIGLVQIKLSTANYLNDLNNEKHITEEDLFKPKTNIKYGCQYLNYLIKKFKNIDTSLAAYNAGETIVRAWLKSGIYSIDQENLGYIPFKETRNYIEKIHKNLKYYSKIFK